MIVDSTDFGSSDPLHTPAFYGLLRQLAAKGVVVINLTSLSWNLAGAQQTVLKHASVGFQHVAVYQVFQPTCAALSLASARTAMRAGGQRIIILAES